MKVFILLDLGCLKTYTNNTKLVTNNTKLITKPITNNTYICIYK